MANEGARRTEQNYKLVLDEPGVSRPRSAEIAREAAGGESEPRLKLNPKHPRTIAEFFVEDCAPHLMFVADDFVEFRDEARDAGTVVPPGWRTVEPVEIAARVSRFLSTGHEVTKEGFVHFSVTRIRVEEVVTALKHVTHRPSDTTHPPCWLEGADPGHVQRYPAHEIVACANGLLHLPTRELIPWTPTFFTRTRLGVNFDPKAPAPERWMDFLASIWGADEQSIECLQEVLGYLLSSDTRQQKIFGIVGPKRSGKGTVARVVTELVGRENCCSPSTAGLAGDFGKSQLIGKSVAIIADARIGRGRDTSAFVETLLSISGEDGQTVNRKFREHWTGTLGVRFLLLMNELLQVDDTSGALVSRFVLLQTTRSFYGKEDVGLTANLVNELPGILLWALDGLDRLRGRGCFRVPDSSRETVESFEALASPMLTFVEEHCIVDANATVPKAALWSAWSASCQRLGLHPGGQPNFSTKLMAAVPSVRSTKLRVEVADGRVVRVPTFAGIRLRAHSDAEPGGEPAAAAEPKASGPGGPGETLLLTPPTTVGEKK